LHIGRFSTARVLKVFPRVTFIVGGAASGKSAWAESFVETSGKSKAYLATSQALDAEMRIKIDSHIARRDQNWSLIEENLDLSGPLSGLDRSQICLIDCATMWLSNHLLRESDLANAQTALLAAIDTCAADLVIVSNEVGHSIVPDTPLARRFREAQGRLNIDLARRADLVVQISVGLPLVLKGQLP
jgi:adenosylcobinamide kinase / adenosylcobinamide-phosphate guanylyltransferase